MLADARPLGLFEALAFFFSSRRAPARSACANCERGQKCASREKRFDQGECAFVQSLQLPDAYRESAHRYDGCVSGRSVYLYVQGDPIGYSDPFGTDRWGPTGGNATTNITFDRGAGTITSANQNGTVVGTYPAGNRTVNNNPWPDGTFSFQYWKNHPENTVSYGNNGNFVFDVPGHTGMGIHSRRNGPQSRTEGCIRTTDEATNDLYRRTRGRQIGEITVR